MNELDPTVHSYVLLRLNQSESVASEFPLEIHISSFKNYLQFYSFNIFLLKSENKLLKPYVSK